MTRRIGRRPVLLALILAVHGAVLLLILGARPPALAIERPAGALSVFDVGVAEAAQQPPEPVEVDVSRSPIETARVMPPPIAPTLAPGGGAAGIMCNLAGAIQAALLADPAAMAEIARIPVDRRSVANAIMLWDGTWAVNAAQQPIAGNEFRRVLRNALLSSSENCLAESQTGPTLLLLPGDGATISLVIGSGPWSWQFFLDQMNIYPGSNVLGNGLGPRP